jgi:transporter family protein
MSRRSRRSTNERVLVAIFGVAFRGERLSPLNWLGVALVACGALLVAF